MRLAILALAFLVGCATAPPKITDAERSARATVFFDASAEDPVSVVSDFLLSLGYSVDRYDERTHLIATNWSTQEQNALSKSIVGEMQIKVQAKVTTVSPDARTEFWLYSRFHEAQAQEELILYPARYDSLVTRFRTYLSGRGLAVR